MSPSPQRKGAEVYKVLEFTGLDCSGDRMSVSLREGNVAGLDCGLVKCLRFFEKKKVISIFDKERFITDEYNSISILKVTCLKAFY